MFNPLSAKITKWSKTLKEFVGNCLSVFDHFVGLALKGLSLISGCIDFLPLVLLYHYLIV